MGLGSVCCRVNVVGKIHCVYISTLFCLASAENVGASEMWISRNRDWSPRLLRSFNDLEMSEVDCFLVKISQFNSMGVDTEQ